MYGEQVTETPNQLKVNVDNIRDKFKSETNTSYINLKNADYVLWLEQKLEATINTLSDMYVRIDNLAVNQGYSSGFHDWDNETDEYDPEYGPDEDYDY